MVAPPTLKLILTELAIPPQLDFLLFGLDKVRPQGNDAPVPEDMLTETRRIFADIRRLLARGFPETIAAPVGPLTRAQLRPQLAYAQEIMRLMHEDRRQARLEQRRNVRRERLLQSRTGELSPPPFPPLG